MLLIATVYTPLPQQQQPVAGIPPMLVNLLLSGWKVGPPPSISDEALAIDRNTAARLPCNSCGKRRGHRFIAMHRQEPIADYRAFAVCQCGYPTEL